MAKIGVSKSRKYRKNSYHSIESVVLRPSPNQPLQHLTNLESTVLVSPHLASAVESLTEPLLEPPTVESPALKSSVLRNVPNEIPPNIVEFLPFESTVSLSLSCQRIYILLGAQYIKALRKTRKRRNSSCYKFLKLLERDLPNHITCFSCKKLHIMERAKTILNDMCYFEQDFLDLGEWDLEFNNFQRAMKLYRQGRNFSPLNILFNDTKTQVGSLTHCAEQQKVVLRIADTTRSFILREQMIYLIPAAKPPSTSNTISWYPEICAHFHFETEYNFRERRLRYQGEDTKDLEWCEIIWGTFKKCKYCMTEFRVDTMDMGEEGEAFVVTRWQDLGQAQSPLDGNWVRANASPRFRQKHQLIEYDEGSICTAFEEEHYSNFEFDVHITEKDWEELLNCRYRKKKRARTRRI
ncbi:hypothetical protein EAF04_009887 [Stromatinia cepivora]|nr:hypothetical protein EAF04_009887 [Stromatinia cepivora]